MLRTIPVGRPMAARASTRARSSSVSIRASETSFDSTIRHHRAPAPVETSCRRIASASVVTMTARIVRVSRIERGPLHPGPPIREKNTPPATIATIASHAIFFVTMASILSSDPHPRDAAALPVSRILELYSVATRRSVFSSTLPASCATKPTSPSSTTSRRGS